MEVKTSPHVRLLHHLGNVFEVAQFTHAAYLPEGTVLEMDLMEPQPGFCAEATIRTRRGTVALDRMVRLQMAGASFTMLFYEFTRDARTKNAEFVGAFDPAVMANNPALAANELGNEMIGWLFRSDAPRGDIQRRTFRYTSSSLSPSPG